MTDKPEAQSGAPKGGAASSDSPPVLPPIAADQPEAGSDVSKGNIVPLEQPADALKMTDMSPSNDAEAPKSDAAPSDTKEPQPSTGNGPPASVAASASKSSYSQPRYQASSSDKGKGPEQPPTPPAKNDDPQGAAKDSQSQGAAKGSQSQDAAKSNEPQGTAKGNEPQGAAKSNTPQDTAENSQVQDSAIGEASDNPPGSAPTASTDGKPVCMITLLVPSGKKHPYRIDENYLTRHKVPIPGLTTDGHPDPFSISAYTLKQQIYRGWRPEWEAAPPTPHKIRLIHLGHVFDDKNPISNYVKPGAWNVVHLTVQPSDITEEEEPKGSSGKNNTQGSGSNNSGRSTRCCVIL